MSTARITLVLIPLLAVPATGQQPQKRTYENRLTPLKGPPPLLADYPKFVEPVKDTARFEAPVLVDDEGADLHVRSWRFSYNARGIIEMPSRLRAKETAVIMVHPWGIDDGQGWRTPEPAGVCDFCTPAKNKLAAQHTREVINPFLKSLRGKAGLVLLSLPGKEDAIRKKLYRSFAGRPSDEDRRAGRKELDEKLKAFSYKGQALPARLSLSADRPVADYFKQFPGLDAGPRYNNAGFWDLPIPVTSDIDVGDDDVVIYDAAGYAPLKKFLQQNKIRHVLLTGYATDMCFCRTTAGYENLSQDFNVFLVGDATLATFPANDSPRFATNAAISFASLNHLITQVSWVKHRPQPPRKGAMTVTPPTERPTRRELLAATPAMAVAAISGAGSPAPSAASDPHKGKALIAITLDLEMSRNFPRWEDTHWDYEKGNLDAAAKKYTVEACKRVKAAGGVVHCFAVGQVFEQADVSWLKQIAQAGHPVGNHTYDHVNVLARRLEDVQFRFNRSPWLVEGKKPAEVIRENVRLCSAALKARVGVDAAGFRTPGGFKDGLADRKDVRAMLKELGFKWVSCKYPAHPMGRAKEEPNAAVYDGIIKAQEAAQPFAYPDGLIEVPMSPVSDINAFRTGRWKLEWYLTALRRVAAWAIEKRAAFDLLAHPSCLGVADPKFQAIELVCELVKKSKGQAVIVGLGAFADRARALQKKA